MVLVTSKFLILFEKLGDFHGDTIHTSTGITLTHEIVKQGLVLAFAASYNWRKDLKACAVFQLHNSINDLLRSLALQLRTIFPTMLDANTCPQQAQVVVHLGNGSNC
ncbi:unannotated protein [freshwater metagenome]|uniref:Unannotated protein n=1 Tax=freshwater metagenome TaxID=449393 RepID=A0A6J6K986_9ZZZZ